MLFPGPAPAGGQKRIIVLGAGEIGFNLAYRLSREDRPVVIVDHNPKKIAAVQTQLDVQALLGSAADPAVLEEAGSRDAGIVAAVTGNDEINLLACLAANIHNPSSLKLARLRNDQYASMSEMTGPEHMNIQAVINPDAEVVNSILRMLAMPTAVDYGEFAGGRVKIFAVEIHAGPLLDRPLTEFPAIVPDRGVRVGGILRGEQLILPGGADRIQCGDVVYFACLEESIAAVLSAAEARFEPIRRIGIVGGGDIGLRLAQALDSGQYRVKLAEKDADRCSVLADQLSHVMVLHGDGTDRDFMRDENMGGMDMIIAVTGDEETNILTCLLGKSIGAPNTITRVNKNGYMPIVRAIGLRLSVNPRLAATNSIVHFLRRGLLLSTLSTHDEEVEMLEAVISASSSQTGRPIKDLPFPAGTNLLAVMRWDEVFIPRGDTVLQPGDRVILLCGRERMGWVGDSLIGR